MHAITFALNKTVISKSIKRGTSFDLATQRPHDGMEPLLLSGH